MIKLGVGLALLLAVGAGLFLFWPDASVEAGVYRVNRDIETGQYDVTGHCTITPREGQERPLTVNGHARVDVPRLYVGEVREVYITEGCSFEHRSSRAGYAFMIRS